MSGMTHRFWLAALSVFAVPAAPAPPASGAPGLPAVQAPDWPEVTEFKGPAIRARVDVAAPLPRAHSHAEAPALEASAGTSVASTAGVAEDLFTCWNPPMT